MSHSGKHIAAIRKDYQLAVLDEQVAGDNPFSFFHKWFDDAHKADAEEVNAMTLATVNAAGKPHARIVLLKGLDEKGFVFFTNYNSEKGRDISENPHVSLVFFWKELERQVCIEGMAEKVSEAESDEYFMSRPAGSRLGAWSSPQSTIIADRSILEENYTRYASQYGDDIPRPQHWGGYRVIPTTIEFWQGRSSRMHDRIQFTRSSNGNWLKNRLAP
ncbi:pyridoxamine 5'-phosphate oxidase [Chitinophagaceae bacterium IBVUCB1]|nr:pyridoxamine 5'-phosphate oxidase [Chitinophagaceae bacterium IBVUCB1]